MGHTRYETDVVAWANEQAALLRAGKFSEIDVVNIADKNCFAKIWSDAVSSAVDETWLDMFPDECAWNISQILSQEFYPD
ncbi:DUF29 family protein [Photorhabdus sp. RM96S]|uniref:DUF29 family protein n=1 Tax=Photorhabdus sp. RM96S TaxID=3342822 RepID=UPI0036DF7A77